jgi:eukaryotic-like serine/threonine-protein kinase
VNARARSPVAFGPYIITRRIARGGMAEIYRARTRKTESEQLARWVAVKMMRPSLGHEELRARLFQREARIASKMLHDNIVPVYAFGNEMDRPYIAMEYIRGRDLSHLLKNEKKGRDLIDYELGLYIGLLASAGLGHAHRLVDEETGPLGIVHRDISPGNVMIGYDGSVKVLDFGVARMNETQGVHTQTGTLRGKFAYMSPEQTLGEELDARSDVFSLGTVLYELLTGINCFRAQNPIATLERVQQLRPVPPSRANRAIPKVVDRVLARCLAKDKKRRFKDCRALEEAIGDFLDVRRPDLRERLTALMDQEFSWEKHEEEQELTREEEEVALFDVVDFALLADVGGLDARNLKVAEEEEASQAEVKRRGIKKEEEGQEVFDEQPNAHEQPTSRISSEIAKARDSGPIDIGDDDEDNTVAQPPLFESSEPAS